MKVYVRERQKIGEGVKQPQFRIVAVVGGQIQFLANHYRKFELELIAKEAGAEIIWMEPLADEQMKKHN